MERLTTFCWNIAVLAAVSVCCDTAQSSHGVVSVWRRGRMEGVREGRLLLLLISGGWGAAGDGQVKQTCEVITPIHI